MKKRNLFWFSSLILVYGIALSGCSRSQAFKKDQTHYQDYPHSYYGALAGEPGSETEGAVKQAQNIQNYVQPKKKIVVFDFWNNTPVQSQELGPYAAYELKGAFFLSKKVLLPEKAETTRKTEDFLNGEDIRVDQLVREGRRLGAAAVVIGRISKMTFRQRGDDIGVLSKKQSFAVVEVEVKLFDMTNGRELLALKRVGNASSDTLSVIQKDEVNSTRNRIALGKQALRDAVLKFTPPLIAGIDKMMWQGNIAKVMDQKIYINAGKASGLVAGDILTVISQGEEVYDQQTRTFLGESKGVQKGTLEVKEFIGEDGAVANVHSGGQFVEGDIVKLY